MILGVSLVVQEFQKGPRLIYRYPCNHSDFWNHHLFSSSSFSDGGGGGGGEISNATAFTSLKQLSKQYFALTDENFAKLFRNLHVNHIFEISINDLELLSYPCYCKPPRSSEEEEVKDSSSTPSAPPQQAPPSPTKPTTNTSLQDHTFHEISMFTLVFAFASPKFFSRIQSNYLVKSAASSSSSSNQTLVENPLIASNHLRQFGQLLCKTSIRRVLETATNLLFTEELKTCYLTKQVNGIFKILEVFLKSQKISLEDSSVPSVALDFRNKVDSAILEKEVMSCRLFSISKKAKEETLPEQSALMMNSPLANEIRLLFHSLIGGNSVDIHFGDGKSTNVPLACKECKLCSSTFNENRVASQSAETYNRFDSKYLPGKYRGINVTSQTILVVADVEVVLNLLYFQGGLQNAVSSEVTTKPANSNSRLFNFLDAADPTKSFLDLSLVLDEPVEELISMANYLQSLGLVEIISVMYRSICYAINPMVSLNPHSKVAKAFELYVKSLDLKVKALSKGNSFQSRKRSSSQNSGSLIRRLDSGERSARSSTDRNVVEESKQKVEKPVKPFTGANANLEGMDSGNTTLTKKGGLIYHDENEIDFEQFTELPAECSFPLIVSLFDGVRELWEIINIFPLFLKDNALEIIVFLLRWHVIVVRPTFPKPGSLTEG